MKRLYYIMVLLAMLVSSCQQDAILDNEKTIKSRSTSNNAFTFIDDCYIYWNNDTYMLDYEIIGSSDIPLDKPIYLWYRIEYTNGMISPAIFETIPAGITTYSSEGSSLGENIASINGMAGATIRSITYTGYAYQGTMDIIGLDDLSYNPTETPSGGGSAPSQNYSFSAEWTKGTYSMGKELKELNYFNVEGGMGRSYTLISKGYFVMEVILTNNSSNNMTLSANDFAIQRLEWNVSPYSKATYMYLTNSSTSSAIANITLAPEESKVVYFQTNELFYEGDGKFDYDTTPPYHIQLAYKDKAICGDDINVEYIDNYTEGWY